MNQALQLAELPFQDIVIYLYTEKLTDTHQEISIAVHPIVQVSILIIHKILLNPHNIPIPVSLNKAPVNAQQAWDDHVDRMKELERRYPSRYGLYLRDKHAPIVINEEYEPETKPKH
jgi:hypothetical protein